MYYKPIFGSITSSSLHLTKILLITLRVLFIIGIGIIKGIFIHIKNRVRRIEFSQFTCDVFLSIFINPVHVFMFLLDLSFFNCDLIFQQMTHFLKNHVLEFLFVCHIILKLLHHKIMKRMMRLKFFQYS